MYTPERKIIFFSKKNILVSLISSCLLILSFPPFTSGWIVWFALIPLFYALERGTQKSALLTGLLTGVLFNTGILYWVAPAAVNYGQLSLPLGIALTFLLSLYLGIYVSLFAGGVFFLRERGMTSVIAAPLLWTCLEYLKSQVLSGFPWENLGYSQYLNLPLIQVSDITGVYGISFIIVFVNAVLYDLLTYAGHRSDDDEKTLLYGKVFSAVMLVLALYIYGNHRISEIRQLEALAPEINVALVQGDIRRTRRWSATDQQEALDIYISLSENRSNFATSLTVWPETTFPFYFQDGGTNARNVLLLAEKSGQWLLLGSDSYKENVIDRDFFNSAFLVSPTGAIAGQYDKMHLVPYAEYSPMNRLFPQMVRPAKREEFHAGSGYRPLSMGKHKIGVMICYEGIFPEVARKYRKNGAQLLVNLANDAWLGKSSAPYQQLSMNTFRAVETRSCLLRAANTGISAIIDPTGEISSRTAIFTRMLLAGKARFIDTTTFYVAYGDVFVYGCSLFLLINCIKYRRSTK